MRINAKPANTISAAGAAESTLKLSAQLVVSRHGNQKSKEVRDMIKQMYNNKQIVQTDLVVDVDGVRVTYHRCDGMWFVFRVLPSASIERAYTAVKKIVDIMIRQSKECGQPWDVMEYECEIASVEQPFHVLRYRFRPRDSQ